MQALINSLHILSSVAASVNKGDVIPLSTGSVTEFYIEPMLSCVGDVDIMFHYSHELAIPQGHPLPTQLPDEFHGRVRVYEIVDSEFPGYVYLVTSYLLTEITDDGKYNVVQYEHKYVKHRFTRFTRQLHDEIQGPAIVKTYLQPSVSRLFLGFGSVFLSDMVPCIRCLSWPLQAADWPTRHRNYGWPDSVSCCQQWM